MSNPSKQSAGTKDSPPPLRILRIVDGNIPIQGPTKVIILKRKPEINLNAGVQKQQKTALCDLPSSSGPSCPVPQEMKDSSSTDSANSEVSDCSDGTAPPYPEVTKEKIHNAVKKEIDRLTNLKLAHIDKVDDDDVPTVSCSTAGDIIESVMEKVDVEIRKYFEKLADF